MARSRPFREDRLSILPSSTSIFPSVYITIFRMDLPVCLYHHLAHGSSRLSILPSFAWILLSTCTPIFCMDLSISLYSYLPQGSFHRLYISIFCMDLPICLYYHLIYLYFPLSHVFPIHCIFPSSSWIFLPTYIPIFCMDLPIHIYSHLPHAFPIHL